jgi:8-oxo-dGTP diphosphatase
MFDKNNRPKVGLGVYIINENNQLLLMKRAGSHGSGTWCPPGGHLEFGESFFDCAKREAKEEVDLDILEIETVGMTNDIHLDEQKHYITVHVKALKWSGAPKNMEPEKCAEISWFDLDKLPAPLFLSNQNFFQEYPGALTN